jgi:hypothetical protein
MPDHTLWTMPLGWIFAHLTPYGRVLTAIAPFLGAIVLRLILGKNRLTRTLLSVGTMWFAANVFLAPYSEDMRQGILKLGRAVWR